jgi:hypothetical protein
VEGSGAAAGICRGQRPCCRPTFWLTPGHPSEPDVWWAGTSPQGLFRSVDGGATWEGVAGFNANPNRKAWCGGDQDGTPDGAKLHSILIDPRDPAHMYIGMSGGGIFESLDAGSQWRPLNKGVRADFLPDPWPEFGHDPHCVRFAGSNPDRLYQQNHCGIYRLDRPGDTWQDIGAAMPKSVGYVGFRRRACARSGHAMGAANEERVAAHRAWRQARRLPVARRGQDVEAAGSGIAEVSGVVDGQAPGDDDRRT